MNNQNQFKAKLNHSKTDAKYNNDRGIKIGVAKDYNQKQTYFVFDIGDKDKWQGVYTFIIK